jgi:hypothetical protein
MYCASVSVSIEFDPSQPPLKLLSDSISSIVKELACLNRFGKRCPSFRKGHKLTLFLPRLSSFFFNRATFFARPFVSSARPLLRPAVSLEGLQTYRFAGPEVKR